MLMMTLSLDRDEPFVSLHGWLVGTEVPEFERVVTSSRVPLAIDLESLWGADVSGLAALRAHRDSGKRLRNVSPYISLLLES
jgi:hypothetical protein